MYILFELVLGKAEKPSLFCMSNCKTHIDNFSKIKNIFGIMFELVNL